jgi:antitoxin component of MazEF toxin-antitoxin module
VTVLTDQNQVTLPAALVQALELTPRTHLTWSIASHRALMATLQPSRAPLAGSQTGRN